MTAKKTETTERQPIDLVTRDFLTPCCHAQPEFWVEYDVVKGIGCTAQSCLNEWHASGANAVWQEVLVTSD
ncbi:hypothetical protein [Arthrobacter sp. 31Y]|uniref:hypothetical protein n=1 Tax=Arthrobacter sp. 31Y TaxID=1115632 RepID=UPI000462FB49|nr:hypothetical protein [Arthrobacter sp. 31Y]